MKPAAFHVIFALVHQEKSVSPFYQPGIYGLSAANMTLIAVGVAAVLWMGYFRFVWSGGR